MLQDRTIRLCHGIVENLVTVLCNTVSRFSVRHPIALRRTIRLCHRIVSQTTVSRSCHRVAPRGAPPRRAKRSCHGIGASDIALLPQGAAGAPRRAAPRRVANRARERAAPCPPTSPRPNAPPPCHGLFPSCFAPRATLECPALVMCYGIFIVLFVAALGAPSRCGSPRAPAQVRREPPARALYHYHIISRELFYNVIMRAHRRRCYENFLHARSLRRAQDVRKQILMIMDRHKARALLRCRCLSLSLSRSLSLSVSLSAQGQ